VNETSSDFLVGNVEAHGNRLWNRLGDEDWDSVPDGSMETVLRGKDLPKDGEGKPAWIASFVPSPAPKLGGRAQYLLLETSRTKVWRHSHKSSYWVCLLEQKDTEASKPRCRPLIDPADASNITLGPGEAASDFTMEIQHGEFSSSGKRIIFARGNDLYLTTTATLFSSNPMRTRITNDGTKHRILNGIADWVYEEEVFESTDAIWSHPDIDHLFAFLRTDDTDVYTIDIPIYDPTDRREADDESYPGHKKLRYPKAGSPNPSVSVWIYDGFGKGAGRIIGIEDAWKVAGGTVEDFLILDVSWYPSGDGLANSAKQPLLLVRSSNRNQTLGKELLVSFDADKHLWIARVARTLSEADGAWINPGPNLPIDSRSHVVLTNRPDDGRQHIGYFSSPESKTIDRWLTWGSGWDVTSIVGVNSTAVIFEATLDPASYERADGKAVSGIERHVWAVDLGTANGIGSFPRLRLLSPRTSKPPAVKRGRNSILQAISGLKSHLGSRSTAEEAGRTESEQPAKFSARAVSPADQYLLLSYSGPALPWTAILPLAQPSGLILMESNERLGAHLRNYSLPTSRFFEIAVETSTGPQSLNTLEIRPPNFDSSGKTKYRALFRVYGGPSSQVVVPSFSLGFHEALASLRTDPYIIYQVDARGTFGRGRNFTTSIYRRLGQLEPQDQHAAARALCSTLPYLDAGRLAIWGWSFGGYLTSRVVDIDREPRTFKAAVAVAPVTDWSFYDSVYAERYLSTPAENPDGYHEGQVKGEGKGWSQGKTLVVHGTADGEFVFRIGNAEGPD
jgi:dipeptidyl aminopeptidase